MKIRMNIEGLDCPHCASKLEGMMKKEFTDAVLNYSLGTLVIETADDALEDDVLQKAQSIANDFEDGISIELRD
ncbi:MAG: heavy-metal-associated domain-containing protein [Succinivibrio sp.]